MVLKPGEERVSRRREESVIYFSFLLSGRSDVHKQVCNILMISDYLGLNGALPIHMLKP